MSRLALRLARNPGLAAGHRALRALLRGLHRPAPARVQRSVLIADRQREHSLGHGGHGADRAGPDRRSGLLGRHGDDAGQLRGRGAGRWHAVADRVRHRRRVWQPARSAASSTAASWSTAACSRSSPRWPRAPSTSALRFSCGPTPGGEVDGDLAEALTNDVYELPPPGWFDGGDAAWFQPIAGSWSRSLLLVLVVVLVWLPSRPVTGRSVYAVGSYERQPTCPASPSTGPGWWPSPWPASSPASAASSRASRPPRQRRRPAGRRLHLELDRGRGHRRHRAHRRQRRRRGLVWSAPWSSAPSRSTSASSTCRRCCSPVRGPRPPGRGVALGPAGSFASAIACSSWADAHGSELGWRRPPIVIASLSSW